MIQTLAELDRLRGECRQLVTKRALTAAGASVVPIPGVDIAADIGLLATMLPAISKRFELDHEAVDKLPADAAQRVFVLAAGMGNNLIGRMMTRTIAKAILRRVGKRVAVASVAKYVPVLGSAIAASIGFGAMKLAGDAHVEDCYRTARALIEDRLT
ncbi:hypothetical protein [uncultured Sphingomonas sp.]|uniref:hypothetical protein n=1 Tax=uncultured Sphingomonas sp. TaxID=158754 RepID=UPI0035CB89DC